MDNTEVTKNVYYKKIQFLRDEENKKKTSPVVSRYPSNSNSRYISMSYVGMDLLALLWHPTITTLL